MHSPILRTSSIFLLAGAVVAACGGGSGTDGGGNGGFGGGTGGSGAAAQGGNGGGFITGGGPGTGGTGAFIGTDGGSSGGTTGLDAGCAQASLVGEVLPANLYFVIDRSGSMNCNLPPTQTSADCENNPQKANPLEPSKWEVTRTAIKDAIGQLEMSSLDVSAGVVMFPTDNFCDVKNTPDVTVSPLDASHEAGLGAFLDTVAPRGDTPLAGAAILAYDYMHRQLVTTGNKFVVLLSDGAETCKPSELPKLLGTDVPAALSVNIKTFVIGVPGSESARALLSQIAFEGGTARTPGCTHNPAPADVGDCHFDMTTTTDFATDLAAALNDISGTVLSCEFDTPTATDAGLPVDLSRVSVRINSDETPKDQDRDCDSDADGWQFNDDQSKIRLCGSACTEATSANATVDIVLGCRPILR